MVRLLKIFVNLQKENRPCERFSFSLRRLIDLGDHNSVVILREPNATRRREFLLVHITVTPSDGDIDDENFSSSLNEEQVAVPLPVELTSVEMNEGVELLRGEKKFLVILSVARQNLSRFGRHHELVHTELHPAQTYCVKSYHNFFHPYLPLGCFVTSVLLLENKLEELVLYYTPNKFFVNESRVAKYLVQ